MIHNKQKADIIMSIEQKIIFIALFSFSFLFAQTNAYNFMDIEQVARVFTNYEIGFGGTVEKNDLINDSVQYTFNKIWKDGSSLSISAPSSSKKLIQSFIVIGKIHSNYNNFENNLFPLTCLMFSPKELKEEIKTWVKTNIKNTKAEVKIGDYSLSYIRTKINNNYSYELKVIYRK